MFWETIPSVARCKELNIVAVKIIILTNARSCWKLLFSSLHVTSVEWVILVRGFVSWNFFAFRFLL